MSSALGLAHDCTQVDMFEPNDVCAAAAPLLDGLYSELTVNSSDPDFYEVSVAAGGTITVDLLFPHSDGNIDAYLWDPALSSCPDVTTPGGPAAAAGQSLDDNETLIYRNVSSSSRTLVLHVEYLETSGCNEYRMLVGTVDGGTVGTSYCAAVPNSTGLTGAIYATGSALLVDNFVRLHARDLPPHSSVFFLTSLAQDFLPGAGGSAGNLCLSGAIGRYVGSGEVLNSGQGGEASLMIDLTRVPAPSGFLFVLPGETRSFQAWHRDVEPSGAATSNFTNGLVIDFRP